MARPDHRLARWRGNSEARSRRASTGRTPSRHPIPHLVRLCSSIATLLLVRVITDTGDGWGECVAMAEPLYSSEYADGAQDVMRSHLIPRLFAAESLDAAAVKPLLSAVKGHPMAKAALEMAVLDAELAPAGPVVRGSLGRARGAWTAACRSASSRRSRSSSTRSTDISTRATSASS